MPAPVALIAFNRPDHMTRTLEALAANPLADQTDLFVFADGPRHEGDRPGTDAVRALASDIQGFRSVTVRARDENVGLRVNIIEGVTEVMEARGSAIVVEDDILTSPAFLTFMNRALDHYRDAPKVWHISGWNYPIPTEGLPDTFFFRTMNCWGWASWADRWRRFDANPEPRVSGWRAGQVDAFTLNGAEPDFWRQIRKNHQGAIKTWACFWNATIFENGGLCLNPLTSLTRNIGMDGSGTHFGADAAVPQSQLAEQADLNLSDVIVEHEEALEAIRAHFIHKNGLSPGKRLSNRAKTTVRQWFA